MRHADRDIIFYTKTHESLERGLPIFIGYTWESVHRNEIRGNTCTQGFGSVVVLFKM